MTTMTEQPGRRAGIYLPLSRGKLLLSYSIPARETYEDISRVLERHYGDQKLEAPYQSQLKPGPSSAADLYKNIQHPSSSCPTKTLSSYQRTSIRDIF
jgi:hypothetical protein